MVWGLTEGGEGGGWGRRWAKGEKARTTVIAKTIKKRYGKMVYFG